MVMPLSANGGTWLSSDTLGKGALNSKTNLVIPYGTYTPTIGTDTVAGEICIDTTNNILYVVNGANNAYALAFNQSLRTTDSPTFADATINSILISTHLGQDVRSSASVSFVGLTLSGILYIQNASGLGNRIAFTNVTDPYNAIDFSYHRAIYGVNSSDLLIKTNNAGNTDFVERLLIKGNAAQGSAGITSYEPLTLPSITIGTLAGVLKATAGAVGGSATEDDIADGSTYKRTHNDFTDTFKGYLNQSVLSSASPAFADATINSILISTHLGQDVRSTASPSFVGLSLSYNYPAITITANIPAVDFVCSQGGGIRWRISPWNDATSISFINVTNSNAQAMRLTQEGNLIISGKLTQSGCLPKNTTLKDVLKYIKKVQPLKRRETQTEVDALERIVLNQQKQIEGLIKRIRNN